MYILKIKSKSKDKEYTSVVLAKNYREDGKIKRKILTTLTDWPESRIEEFQKFLKGGRVVKIEDLPLKQCKSIGALYVMNEIARQTCMIEALGDGREGKMALFQIYARLITQGSIQMKLFENDIIEVERDRRPTNNIKQIKHEITRKICRQ